MMACSIALQALGNTKTDCSVMFALKLFLYKIYPI